MKANESRNHEKKGFFQKRRNLLVLAGALFALSLACCLAAGLLDGEAAIPEEIIEEAVEIAEEPLQATDTAPPEPTDTPQPTGVPELTDTPEPTDTPPPTDTPEATDTPRPTDTPEPTNTPAGPRVILTDDFSDPLSGWDTFDDADGRAVYQDGSLVIRDSTANPGRTSSHLVSCHVRDVIVEFDVKWIGGTDDNWQSVEVRQDGKGNNYGFDISADGFYGIVIDVAGVPEQLAGITRSNHIRRGQNVVNSVRASAIGSTLRLSVNGHLLAEVTDTRLKEGHISFSVSSLAGQYSEVAFMNLVVMQPE